MPLYLGTSGWQYKHWKETFYPRDVPQKRWLEYFADRFQTVELNNSFYSLPKPETFAAWRVRTPTDFIVAVKMSRYLTHIRRLKEPQESVDRFMANAVHLGPKLGPILLQLPPNLKIDLDALDKTLACFQPGLRLTVEFRHDSWFVDETRALLAERKVSTCLADKWSKPVTPMWRTADWGFLRFHAGTADPEPCYGRTALASWAQRLAEHWGPDDDVYVYFNNDPRACALRDARVFARAAEKLGFKPTRIPKADEVRLG